MRGAPRRTLVILASVLTLSWLGVSSAIHLASRPAIATRHEDPTKAVADPDPTSIFEWYRGALSPFTTGQVQEGRRLISALNGATLPADLQGIVRELNGFLLDAGTTLEAADALLRQASALIAAGRLNEAKPVLAQLDRLARQGSVLLDGGVQNFTDLARRTNLEALPLDGPQRRAYQDLQRLAARTKALLIAYRVATQDPRATTALAKLLPYQTAIDLSVPSSAYPGREFTVSGAVREQGPVPSRGRRVTLLLDDQVLATFPVGRFTRQFSLPNGIPTGQHRLGAVVAAKDRYLAASVQKVFRISQAPVELHLRTAQYALAPGRLVITGIATSAFGPVPTAKVQVHFGPVSGEGQTSTTGEFQVSMALPATVHLVGPEAVSVRLVPTEPWHASAEQHRDLLVINLITTGLTVLLVPVAGLAYGTTRRRGRPPSSPLAPPVQVASSSLALVPVEGRPLGTDADQMLAIYLDALRRVQSATTTPLQSSTTLREFATLVRSKLHSDTFLQMTGLAEVALYSSHQITQAQFERAQHLKHELDQELARAIH